MKKKYITLTSLPLSLGLYHTAAKPASAEELSVGILPTVTEITAAPGDTLETQVTVRNNDDAPVTLTTLLQSFTASGDEDGSVRYVDEAPDIFRSIQIFSERERVNEVTLGPQEEKRLTMRIHVPASEGSRDYYYSLVFLTKPVQTDSALPQEGIRASSTLSGGVAGHFLVSVHQKPQTELKVAEFSAPALTQHPPVPFTVRISNVGSNFTKVHGEIQISSILGQVQEIRIPKTTILSQSTRAMRDPEHEPQDPVSQKDTPLTRQQETGDSAENTLWQTGPLWPGIYRAHLTVKNDRDTSVVSETLYFAVIPLQLIFGLFALGIISYLIRRRFQNKFS